MDRENTITQETDALIKAPARKVPPKPSRPRGANYQAPANNASGAIAEGLFSLADGINRRRYEREVEERAQLQEQADIAENATNAGMVSDSLLGFSVRAGQLDKKSPSYGDELQGVVKSLEATLPPKARPQFLNQINGIAANMINSANADNLRRQNEENKASVLVSLGANQNLYVASLKEGDGELQETAHNNLEKTLKTALDIGALSPEEYAERYAEIGRMSDVLIMTRDNAVRLDGGADPLVLEKEVQKSPLPPDTKAEIIGNLWKDVERRNSQNSAVRADARFDKDHYIAMVGAQGAAATKEQIEADLGSGKINSATAQQALASVNQDVREQSGLRKTVLGQASRGNLTESALKSAYEHYAISAREHNLLLNQYAIQEAQSSNEVKLIGNRINNRVAASYKGVGGGLSGESGSARGREAAGEYYVSRAVLQESGDWNADIAEKLEADIIGKYSQPESRIIGSGDDASVEDVAYVEDSAVAAALSQAQREIMHIRESQKRLLLLDVGDIEDENDDYYDSLANWENLIQPFKDQAARR